MIYLSISVSAALTFDEKSYYMIMDAEPVATDLDRWREITELPMVLHNGGSSVPSVNDNQVLFLLFDANHIITEGDVIVIQVAIRNIADSITLDGVGKITESNYLPGKSFFCRNALSNLIPDQQVIATTIQEIGNNTKRITITFTAAGFINTYVFARFPNLYRDGTEVLMTEIDLYDSVEDAAGSGTTPEEMRAVLEEWSEETLLPGIGQEVGDQIKDKVPGAVEDALNQHDQQQETQAGSKIEQFKEQLQEAIDPYFENTSEIRDALHGGLMGVFGYSGTNAVITLPAANNPMADGAQLWPQLTVDLGYWWNQLPAALRSMITIYATFVILYCCLSEMLDTINTILIHRELLGLPDDEFGIRARSRGD